MNTADDERAGGAVTGRWEWRPKRPWVSGPRPWQYKDPILVLNEAKPTKEVPFLKAQRLALADLRAIEARQLAFYEASLQTSLEASRQRALKSIRYKARWEHTLRGL